MVRLLDEEMNSKYRVNAMHALKKLTEPSGQRPRKKPKPFNASASTSCSSNPTSRADLNQTKPRRPSVTPKFTAKPKSSTPKTPHPQSWSALVRLPVQQKIQLWQELGLGARPQGQASVMNNAIALKFSIETNSKPHKENIFTQLLTIFTQHMGKLKTSQITIPPKTLVSGWASRSSRSHATSSLA